MMKFTAIYTEQVGYNAGQCIVKKIYVEAPSASHQHVWKAINEAGYLTQKPGFEWDIADGVVFLFYGHVEDVMSCT